MKMHKRFSLLILNLNFFLLAIAFKGIVAQDFQVLTPKTLTTGTSLMPVKDYENMNLIITKKEIFTGLNPVKIGEFDEEFPQSTSFATYNSEYILAACTNKGLLSYIKINSLPLEEVPLISYSDFNLTKTDYVCSISYLDPIVYLVHASENRTVNLIQIKMFLDESSLSYNLDITYIKNDTIYFSKGNMLFECEPAKVKRRLTESFLLCLVIEYDQGNYYHVIQPIVPKNTSAIMSYSHTSSKNLLFYKFQKINDTKIRYLSEGISKVFNAAHGQNYGIGFENSENKYLESFLSSENLFFHNNEYIFHASQSKEQNSNYNLYITNAASNNSLILIAINKPLEKVSGFYNKTSDKFIYIYQYSGTIEYVILQYKCFSNAWHIDTSDNSIVCYDDKLYCQSNQYYYHTNTRECVLTNCRNGYFRFNFECYKDNCPAQTTFIPQDNKCESDLNYCYIDEHYKTFCSETQYVDYTLRYENTKIYFKSCSDSEYFFNVKTYHFQKVCYKECPENTAKNEANSEWECIYYKNFIDKANDEFVCLNENDVCKNHGNKYSKTDVKECAENKAECLNEGYKILNTFCYKNCPENTINVGNNCECQYHYYKENNELFCFPQEKSCENIGHPIESNENRCFLSKDDCISNSYKFFNNKCFLNSCPENTNDDESDGICFCSNYYYKDYNTSLYNCLANNEECESKGYNYKIVDKKQCFDSLEDCRRKGFKTFNNECLEGCPEKTNEKNNDGICHCSHFYFYNTDDHLYDCLAENEGCEQKHYPKKIDEVKQCFLSLDDCISKKFKVFNGNCYKECPNNTNEKNNNGICLCSFFFYKDFDTETYNCLSENEICSLKGYNYKIDNEKQCFDKLEDCIKKGFKTFNNECYSSCPVNTYEKDDSSICFCSYFYYKDYEITSYDSYDCLSNNEECVSKGYNYTIDDKNQCFTSLEDCKRKGFKTFNNECYIDCPENTNEKIMMVFVIVLIFIIMICPGEHMIALQIMKNVYQKDTTIK